MRGRPGGATHGVRTRIRIALTGLAIAAIVAAGLLALRDITAAERDRDLRAWQTRLGIVADSRAQAVSDWVDGQYRTLDGIADNLSVQLYMTRIRAAGGAPTPETLASQGYLRNLLDAVADRAGFSAPPLGPQVNANVRRVGVAGIALLDAAGNIVAATPGMPPIEGALADWLVQAAPAGRDLYDVHLDAAGRPAMGFSVPVYAVQSDRTPDQRVGRVVGVRQVADTLYPALRQPGQPWSTAEAVLVRAQGAAVAYVSPTRDGAKPLAHVLSRDTQSLVGAWALDHPGGFTIGRDYRDAEVLATARAIPGTGWALVYKIDRAEALAGTEARLRRLTIGFLLAMAVVVVALFAMWRHGASVRASRAASELAVLARRHESQRRLLQLVTDSQPNAITIVDAESRYLFANRPAAERAGIDAADMIGKTLAAVLGPAAAARIERLNQDARAQATKLTDVARTGANGTQRVVLTHHVPVPASPDMDEGVLVVEEDVTAAVTERERRERTQRQLVTMLVRLVDRRDPYAADHSARVAAVARAIATEMELDPVGVDTAETAGKLMNLGKILVPSAVLTKPGALTDDELRQVRDSLQAVADVLEEVEFDGPVVATLRQLQERWDGSGGPAGLAGENILITARVVAVANAFVAMVSDRAFRAGIGLDDAASRLMGEAGRAFDRRAIAALVNRLDNRGGRSEWAGFHSAAPAP